MSLLKHPVLKMVTACLLLAIFLIVPPLVRALAINEHQARQTAQQKYGASGVQNLDRWFGILSTLQNLPPDQQLKEINNFWNRIALAGEDKQIWGVEDYWATPLETLGRGRADCEDYVIGKYFSLIHLGVSADKLRLIYVRAQVGGASIAHMVLGYYSTPDAEPLLLDNLTGLIRPASQRPDLTPVFSFNSQGVFVGNQAQSSIDRISRWRGLLDKMRNEGFSP